MASETFMQKRIREATENNLVRQLGFSRYNNGELRPPPATGVEAEQQALVDIAEQRICDVESADGFLASFYLARRP